MVNKGRCPCHGAEKALAEAVEFRRECSHSSFGSSDQEWAGFCKRKVQPASLVIKMIINRD